MSSGRHPRILAGRYRLNEVIGRGGMSTVYRGTDLALDRVVAVKVALDPIAEENPVYVARFKREARAAAALNHPGVVTVYDAGADRSTRFIVMEYVAGRSLSEIMSDHRPLEPERAARIAGQVADTLAAAHAAGIVHRDVKPGNVMVGDGDKVKVLDFGIARTSDAVTLTQTASVLGTAPYMAPEQAMGQPADARSDIYSLGCVLYEMLTGQPPFMAEVPAAVLHQHVRVEPEPATARNPAVPAALGALVMQMLAKDPKDRPQTAGEVRERLRDSTAADGTNDAPTESAIATVAMAAAAPPPATVPQAGAQEQDAAADQAAGPEDATVPLAARRRATSTGPPPGPSPRRSRRGLWATLAVISVLLLGGAVALALSGGSGSGGGGTSPPANGTQTNTGTATEGTTRTNGTSPTNHTTAPTTPTTPTTTTPTTPTETTPTTTTTAPGETSPTTTTATPPGHGGTPPGQAKKGNGP